MGDAVPWKHQPTSVELGLAESQPNPLPPKAMGFVVKQVVQLEALQAQAAQVPEVGAAPVVAVEEAEGPAGGKMAKVEEVGEVPEVVKPPQRDLLGRRAVL